MGKRSAASRADEQRAVLAHLGGEERLEHGHASGRRADHGEPAMLDGIPAAGATSSQTSRERIARRQHSPRCWPVTVTKPKLRIEAPFACASRSITTTLQAAPRGRQRMRQPADARADDGEVEAARDWAHRVRHACDRGEETPA